MSFASYWHRPFYRAFLLVVCVLAVMTGCCRDFVMRSSWSFNWYPRGCQNCDSCRPRLLPWRACANQCPTCGERGCTRACCRATRNDCVACNGILSGIQRAFGLGCRDPRVPNHHQAKHYPPPGGDPGMDMWTTDGPGYFHPVPTRPVFGPQPTPVDAVPKSDNDAMPEEDASDPGSESIPLRDMPRNLDTPNDPRNVLPPEELESTPEDYPPESSSSVLKKYPVEQTGWRARTK